MIGVRRFVNCVNATTSTTLDPLGILQLASVAKDFDTTGFVVSVSSSTNLPLAADNTGRFIYVEDLGFYKFSNGITWESDAGSPPLWAWGCNTTGQLGDNTFVDKSSPVNVVGTNWCQVSAGQDHTIALKSNGTAWSWGTSGYGQLGNNCAIAIVPVSVVGGFTDWSQVSAGDNHVIGLRTNGTAWSWGSNSCGQLGDGTTVSKSSPVSVVGGFTDWCQVSAGFDHSLGVRINGTAWAWGSNSCGQLGDGTTVSKSSPVSVVGGFTWCQVSASGLYHSLGIRNNGTLWAWGYNGLGQLGDGTQTLRLSPVSVVGGFTDWCQVSASRGHSVGVRINGTAWAWGFSQCGQLGNGTTVAKSSPVSVVGGFTDWCQVSASRYHTLGLRTNGTLWAWGNNAYGQLGDDTTVNSSSPVSVVGGFTDWCQVSGGSDHSLAIRI